MSMHSCNNWCSQNIAFHALQKHWEYDLIDLEDPQDKADFLVKKLVEQRQDIDDFLTELVHRENI